MILDIMGIEHYIPVSRVYFSRFFNRLVPIRIEFWSRLNLAAVCG